MGYTRPGTLPSSLAQTPPASLAGIQSIKSMYNSGLGALQADVAQLVEQLIRNEKVEGSTPFIGTSRKALR